MVFRTYLKSFDYRNQRLNLRRLLLHADIIKERASGVLGITFNDVMQADFLLFIRDLLDKLNQKENDRDSGRWFPVTMVYAEHRSSPFEIFARAQQSEYFDKLKRILGAQNKADIDKLVASFRSGEIKVPNFGGWAGFDPVSLMNYNSLATL